MATQRYVLEALEPLGISLTVASSDPLQVLLDWLPSHLGEDLHVDNLAAVARISTRRLQELCHDRYGCTPMAPLRQYRLDALHADLAVPQEIFIGIGNCLKDGVCRTPPQHARLSGAVLAIPLPVAPALFD